jgi:hypothetical protein
MPQRPQQWNAERVNGRLSGPSWSAAWRYRTRVRRPLITRPKYPDTPSLGITRPRQRPVVDELYPHTRANAGAFRAPWGVTATRQTHGDSMERSAIQTRHSVMQASRTFRKGAEILYFLKKTCFRWVLI